MNSLTSTCRLSNGYEIPVVGFDTWQTPDGDVAVPSVKEALATGYRYIDTAQGYKSKESVGQAIKENGILREETFLIIKSWNANHSYELVVSSFEESLKRFQTDYVDPFLIHWSNPVAFRDDWEQVNVDIWRVFEELYEMGKIKAIGVSNSLPHHLDIPAKTVRIIPMVNQVFLAPDELQPDVAEHAKKHEVIPEAYSPLGTSKVFDVLETKQTAEVYDKIIVQVTLRWSLQHGFLSLPKSITPSRIRENTESFDLELTEEEMKQIDQLDGVIGKAKNPDTTQF